VEHRRRDRATVARVAVIGCGNIGSRLDELHPDAGAVLSHAGAYQKSPRAQLVALCDADPRRLEEAGKRREVAALYTDYRALLRSETVDVLSICTPVTERLPVLAATLEAGVRTVFCEKPLAATVSEGELMRELAARHGAAVAVNYLRRWDPAIREVASLIGSGRLGRVQHAVGYYDKGVSNNGSHLIDLLNFFFGSPVRAAALRRVADGCSGADPTLDCALEYDAEAGRFPAYLVASDHRHFSLFELDITGTKGRVRITDKGRSVRLYSVWDDAVFPGYRTLSPPSEIAGDLNRAVLHAVEELLDVFAGVVPKPRCGIEEALDVLHVVESLKASAGERIEEEV
jgi:predicted dehydrogenase